MAQKKITELQLIDEVTAGLNYAVDDSIQTYRSTAAQLLAYVQSQLSPNFIPSGTVISSLAGSTPAGYLYCDGSAVSRATYPDLYAAIGDACGEGDGTTTFNLPDLRGYFLRGQDDAAGVDLGAGSRTAQDTGGNTGDNPGTLQGESTKLPNTSFTTGVESGTHTHGQNYATAGGGSGAYQAPGNATLSGSTPTGTQSSNHTHTVTGGGDDETRPKNMSVRYYIKS